MVAAQRWISPIVLATVFVFVLASHAAFHPERMYRLRKKISLNLDWKFYRNDPAGNAYETAYDDASWETVNLPHSAMYVPPTPEGERTTLPGESTWSGICWYRKTFTVPQGAHTQRVFLEFEGAMQSSEVYLNGQRIGGHGASGYTAFGFDISAAVNRTGQNLLAVRLDCNYKWEIPPGNVPNSGAGGEYPDFYIFNGLYRDVWLVCTDNVYIPAYGHKITTPELSSSSGTVRIRATVNNAGETAAECTVMSVIVDTSGAVVAQASAAGSVTAGGSRLFDYTAPAITAPALWSPETPGLYRVFTKVFIDDQEVDDQVDRFGFRTIEWRTAGGFFLNGTRYVLKGVNMHQVFAWVGNALPESRYYEEVRLVKEMGANAIRCAHYPRCAAFYDACDEIGILCEPELPSWGGSITSYPAIFWSRMDSCAQAMVNTGFNHPSIIFWGLFNEAAGNFPQQFTALCNTIKGIDSTRFTAVVNNKSQSANQTTDIYGYNYSNLPNWSNARYYNAEYHEGWMIACFRGDTINSTTKQECLVSTCYLRSENDYATERYDNRWIRDILSKTGDTKPLAGGHMWCFVDYWSPCNVGNHPMGVLDHYRIPKKVYYTFQSNWRSGTAGDYPVTSLTGTKVRLEADVTTLVADSTDLSRVIGSIRDASGDCVWSSAPITFQVTGPADVFEGTPVTRNAIAGKIGIIIKSRKTPGAVTIAATSEGLEPATLTLTIAAADTSPLPFIWPSSAVGPRTPDALSNRQPVVRHTGRAIVVAFGAALAGTERISLLTIQGKLLPSSVIRRATTLAVATDGMASGCYRLRIEAGDRTVYKTIVLAR
ncbi:MAG: hypothetical protein JXA18_10340 [Chitinispirillaceae bacterium]|nr:hypothetical protein [Chitinispirillaceae bacterium]